MQASGYLAARPGHDPFGRMPALRSDLAARGWIMRYPPELTIYIQSPCHHPRAARR
ncbi:MAG TPA: hypothetical protein VFR67_22850 [Pilimelia sp.]|nr:hypothetical protein [Pilimelia sp.]